MRFTVIVLLAALVGLYGCKADQASAKSDEDGARAALEKIDAIKMPALGAGTQEDYQRAYYEAWKQKAPLVIAFAKAHPDHLRTPALMNEYWQSLMSTDMTARDCDNAIKEIEQETQGTTNAMVRRHGAFWETYYAGYRDRNDPKLILKHADDFANQYPDDTRAAALYSLVTASENIDDATQATVYHKLVDDYPQTPEGKYAQTIVRLLPSLNKRFDFAFKDFTTGKRITTDSLKGKVVVVDFWATWCNPCIAELPHMKDVYKKYKSKGVQFIGVSFDRPEEQGGRADLQKFLKEYDVEWPQFYMNDDTDLASKHGIETIPTVFILDKNGVVRSVDGYRVLERTLDDLLAG
ncbi:MAG TPA: TlpA disulfide reductase family protein [Fimbriimonadaceae bacterium]|nr:TlpA disulfide reductase family protein [Fimbriimonadaceae bacterium]